MGDVLGYGLNFDGPCLRAQYNASQLITQREQVSMSIRTLLIQRAANFNMILDDVSITALTFGKEYTAAIEAKQVAQQEAERAKFVVEKAIQARAVYSHRPLTHVSSRIKALHCFTEVNACSC